METKNYVHQEIIKEQNILINFNNEIIKKFGLNHKLKEKINLFLETYIKNKIDTFYDKDIEYKAELHFPDRIDYVIFPTLFDLFDDLYGPNQNLIFDSEEKKNEVRESLKNKFTYDLYNLKILQVDKSIEDKTLVCTCPVGFKGNGAFCEKCK